MTTQPPQSSTTERISVNVRSESDPLKTVVMCWANPPGISTIGDMVVSAFDSSVRQQLRHNCFKVYNYKRVREQQKRVVQILRDHGVTVLLLGNVPGVCSQHYTRDIAFCIDDVF